MSKNITCDKALSRLCFEYGLEHIKVADSINNSKLSIDALQRVIAAGLQEKLIQNYFSNYESVKEIKAMGNVVNWLKGAKRKAVDMDAESLPGLCDHTKFYSAVKDGVEKRIVLTQPYITALDSIREFGQNFSETSYLISDFISWCDENGIDFSFSHNSWYFFGRSVLIELKAKPDNN